MADDYYTAFARYQDARARYDHTVFGSDRERYAAHAVLGEMLREAARHMVARSKALLQEIS